MSPEDFKDYCIAHKLRAVINRTIGNERVTVHIWTVSANPLIMQRCAVAGTREIANKRADYILGEIDRALGFDVVAREDAGPPPLYGDPGPKLPSAPIAMTKANGQPCEKCHKPMITFGCCGSCGHIPGRTINRMQKPVDVLPRVGEY